MIRPDGWTEVGRFPAPVKPFTLATVIETLAEEPVVKLTLLRLAATVTATVATGISAESSARKLKRDAKATVSFAELGARLLRKAYPVSLEKSLFFPRMQ